jgi:hypothetical protein
MCGPLEDAVELMQILVSRHFSAIAKVYGALLRTGAAADWKQKFAVHINGRSRSNDPRAMVEKIEQLLVVAQGMGVPVLQDGTVIDGGALFEQTVGALEFPFGLEGIVKRPEAPLPGAGGMDDGTGGDGNQPGGAVPGDLAGALEGLLASGFDPSAFGGDAGALVEPAGGLPGGVG